MVLGQLLAQRQYREHRRKQRAEIEERRARGADEDVISVSMRVAAMAANEFLARLYRTRNQPNRAYPATRMNLSENEIEVSAALADLSRRLQGADRS
jgi:hypothetical protein